MQPDLQVNYLAIAIALVVKAALGSLWYGPLFGRIWNRELDYPPNFALPAPALMRARVLRWIGMALTVYVLALAVEVIRPSSWGAGVDGPSALYGFLAALFVWVGFYVPQQLSRVGWEGTSWKLLRIHAYYHLVALQVAAQILAHGR
jgi:hypothetical protein